MEQVIKLITDLGFPIACVIFLGWYTTRLTSMYREDLKEMIDKYLSALKDSADRDKEEAEAITKLEEKISEKDN